MRFREERDVVYVEGASRESLDQIYRLVDGIGHCGDYLVYKGTVKSLKDNIRRSIQRLREEFSNKAYARIDKVYRQEGGYRLCKSWVVFFTIRALKRQKKLGDIYSVCFATMNPAAVLPKITFDEAPQWKYNLEEYEWREVSGKRYEELISLG